MTAPSAAARRLDPALLRMGGVLSLGAILATLDTTIVNVGIDAVARDFASPLATIQWVSTGYLLALSVVIPLTGWMISRFGARRMWIASVAVFTATSVLCGLAWSAPALIVFRVLQGLGGGLMQPIGQAMIAQAAGPSRITRVISVLVVPITFAPVVGPVLGGFIVRELDWRWMFFVNVPIGVVTVLLAARVLPADGPREAGARLDTLGLCLLSPGLAAVVYGLSEAGNTGGFGAGHVVFALLAGVALLLGYGVHAVRGRIAALIDLRLFARRGFAAATTNSFLLGASLYSSMLLLPLYYQQIRHADALAAGLLLAPQALGTAVVLTFAGRLTDRFSPRAVILGGIGLSLAGTVAFTQLGSAPPAWLLTASLVLRGAGIGSIMGPNMGAVYASVDRADVPKASAALNVLNRVGGSLGTAVLAVILQNQLQHTPDAPAAYGHTFWWALGLSAVTVLPALFFPRRTEKD
ncbi:DHA2 family efflux MFS transporter permease subunit [Amycolatopsis anabasis]|uniref:DHA2 family efflux MFS transporter permease subunit n=1 Tax=Amycolatopsis anabasis TaxID=1840409 RepID=UPI00131A8CF0|nr:DHA2 family efflux MFS transporter permease subunit [Amycolatopsis anabasis]